jgi:GH25 family lysozyme M1 (1,4-beta-N-acetylmuramidase)
MKFNFIANVLTLTIQAVFAQNGRPEGFDVSHNNPNVNWSNTKSNGAQFVYIKATDGTTYIDPSFNENYTGATNAGLIRGGYHTARPDSSSGAAQANYFLAHGGGWTGDGITLPGALELKKIQAKAECFGLSTTAMVSWIRDFSNTYHGRTGRYPVIFTSTSWWKLCTGNASGFQNNNPLWIVRIGGDSPGELPAGYSFHTFRQYSDSGKLPGSQDRFNGDAAGLSRLARG